MTTQSNKRPIVIVQGTQYGSEAKGAISLFLCEQEQMKYAVRTGSINAGHTIVHEGRKVAFQQVPVGAVLPHVTAVIGPGAYVCQDTLMSEAEIAGCRDRIIIDHNCGVHLQSYTEEAAAAARNLKIGATGKGCAEAIIHKIKDRGVGTPLLLRDRWDKVKHGRLLTSDTVEVLMDAYASGDPIMVEGTQGTLLDFHTGPYPFVTSRQTIASAWVCEAGLSPALNYEVVLVARTYPIRVAGNSGPMGTEISWPLLARRMNDRLRERGMPLAVPEESIVEFERALSHVVHQARRDGVDESSIGLYSSTQALKTMDQGHAANVLKLFETTTVTKRLRRLAELDVEQLRKTVKREHPAYLCLTFLNYVFPELAVTRELHGEAIKYLLDLQAAIGCWIKYVSIGPRSEDVIRTSNSPMGPTHHWLHERS